MMTTTKTAVITGAGRGLGLEFARQCLLRGHRVIGAVRDIERASALRALSSEIALVTFDASDAASIGACAREIQQITPTIDLLINNAGINSRSSGIAVEQQNVTLGSLEADGILTMVRVNAIAPLLLTQALLPALAGANPARVVLISSWLGSNTVKTTGGNYGYCASKATLNMLGRTLGLDLKAHGIVCALFNPGWVQTDMGGGKAKLTPEQSVGGILSVIETLTIVDNGGFFEWSGAQHPW
jgi:NAD(P)-dependent dehydrogenase (short-subunit alcohol dehydrogenase family)